MKQIIAILSLLTIAASSLFQPSPPKVEKFDVSTLAQKSELDRKSVEFNLQITKLQEDIAELKQAKPKPAVVKPKPAVVKPQPKQGGSTAYKPRWHPTDGSDTRLHAINVHGISSNLPDSEIFRQHDAWHDKNGPAAPRQRSVSVRTSIDNWSTPSSSNCPGGVCPTNQQRRAILPWRR